MKYKFQPQWREELVCSCADGTLTFEFSMGSAHAYFPTENTWREHAPAWATELRAEILASCRRGARAKTYRSPSTKTPPCDSPIRSKEIP